MARTWHRSVAALLVVLALPLLACETKTVRLQLPGFAEGAIDGVWLWRRNEKTGQFERVCRIAISDPVPDGSGEAVDYIQECLDDHEGYPMQAEVQRLPGDPQSVEISIWYVRWEDPGVYKASAYNAVGESALSPTELTL